MKLVSIVLPTYNNETTIEFCITSLLGQSYPNTEILVVNDRSTDLTLLKLKQFEKVKIFTPESKLGRSGAKNYGLRRAKGYYVFFAEGDAYYDLNYIDKCVNLLEKDPSVASAVGLRRVWNKNKSWVTRATQAEWIYASKNRSPLSGWFFRKKQTDEIGFFKDDLAVGEDFDFSNRIRRFGKVVWCKEVRWHHWEPSTLLALFRKNYSDGKSLSIGSKNNRANCIKSFAKNFYLPGVVLLLILNIFFWQLWLASFLSVIPIAYKYFKLVFAVKSFNTLPIVILWFVKSFARLVGMLAPHR